MKQTVLMLLLAASTMAASAQTQPAATPAQPATPAAKPASPAAKPASSAAAAKPAAPAAKPGTAAAKPAATPAKPAGAATPKLPFGVPAPGLPPVKTLKKTLYTILLTYQDIKVGTGVPVEPGKQVKYFSTLWLAADGHKLDSTDDHRAPVYDKDHKQVMDADGKPKMGDAQPATLVIGQGRAPLPGWELAFEGMKVGGKRRVFIPWQLGLGLREIPARDATHPGIPAKSDMILDLDLQDVTEAPPQMRPGPSGGGHPPMGARPPAGAMGGPPQPGAGSMSVPPAHPGAPAAPNAPGAPPNPPAPATPAAPAPAAPSPAAAPAAPATPPAPAAPAAPAPPPSK
ncbi:MAG: FKBP-type peptidyl-prolyl cis-trans isomerase [Terracidiphilus sp.]|jgi:peptidylprolyl isomerase